MIVVNVHVGDLVLFYGLSPRLINTTLEGVLVLFLSILMKATYRVEALRSGVLESLAIFRDDGRYRHFALSLIFMLNHTIVLSSYSDSIRFIVFDYMIHRVRLLLCPIFPSETELVKNVAFLVLISTFLFFLISVLMCDVHW